MNKNTIQKYMDKELRRQEREIIEGKTMELSPDRITKSIQTQPTPQLHNTFPKVNIYKTKSRYPTIDIKTSYQPQPTRRSIRRPKPILKRPKQLSKKTQKRVRFLSSVPHDKSILQKYLDDIHKNIQKDKLIRMNKYSYNRNERIEKYTELIDKLDAKTRAQCPPQHIINPYYIYNFFNTRKKPIIPKEIICVPLNTDKGKRIFAVSEYFRQHGEKPHIYKGNLIYDFLKGKYIHEDTPIGQEYKKIMEYYRYLYSKM